MSFLDDMKKTAAETKAAQEAATQEWKTRTLSQASVEIDRIIERLQSDIEKEAKGPALGSVRYNLLTNWLGITFDNKRFYPVNANDIRSLSSYTRLQTLCSSIGVKLDLSVDETGPPENRIGRGWHSISISGWG